MYMGSRKLMYVYIYICVDSHMGPRRLKMGNKRLMYSCVPYMGQNVCM